VPASKAAAARLSAGMFSTKDPACADAIAPQHQNAHPRRRQTCLAFIFILVDRSMVRCMPAHAWRIILTEAPPRATPGHRACNRP